MTETRHPACGLSETEKSDYLASVAFNAWGERAANPTSLAHLEEMCATLGISGDAAHRAAVSALTPHSARAGRLAQLRQTALGVALLTDVIALVFDDESVAAPQAAAIARLARELHMTTAEIVLIGRYVEAVVQGHSDEKLARKLAEQLAALPSSIA